MDCFFLFTVGEDDYRSTQHETLTRLLKELRIPAEVRVQSFITFTGCPHHAAGVGVIKKG